MANKETGLTVKDIEAGMKAQEARGEAISSFQKMILKQLKDAEAEAPKVEGVETVGTAKAGKAKVAGDSAINSNILKILKEIKLTNTILQGAFQPKSKGPMPKVDMTEADIEQEKRDNDLYKMIKKIEENTRLGGKAKEQSTDSGGGMLSNIGGAIKGLGSGISNTAKNLLLFSAALWITSKALQNFASVEWESIGKAAVAIGALGLAARLAGTGNAYKSILALGVGTVALAYGLTKLADVEWAAVLKGAVAMGALALAARLAGTGDAYKSILALGVGTLALAYGLDKLSDVDWGSIVKGAVAMGALTLAARLAGTGDAYKSILALGAGTVLLAFGLNEFAKVEWGSIAKGAVAVGALAAAALIAGTGDAWKSILALGVGTIALAYGFSKFADVKWESVAKGVVSLGALGVVANMLSGATVGIVSMIALGGAVWVMAEALEKFQGIDWESIGKGMVAIAGLGALAAVLGLAVAPILAGALALAALGASLMLVGAGLDAVNKAMGKTPPPKGQASTPATNNPWGPAYPNANKAPLTSVAAPATQAKESEKIYVAGKEVVKGKPLTKEQVIVTDMSMKDGNTPDPRIKESYDLAKKQVSTQQVTPMPTAGNKVYGESAKVDAAKTKTIVPAAPVVVSAPTTVNNTAQNTVIKSPLRNPDNTLRDYNKTRFSQ